MSKNKKKINRKILQDKGQFWTPDWIAEAMVSYVAKDAPVIFDPATGTGAFLKGLRKISLSKSKFYGIDIDETVLKEQVYTDKACDVEVRDFLLNPPKKKFHAIVANPPYIRHHKINKMTKEQLKNLSKQITGTIIDGRAGYHIYFLIQALDLLENNGKLAFIMPADTCEGKFANRLWSWITSTYSLDCVITFAEASSPFPNVDTNAVIFLIRKASQKNKLFWINVKKQSNELYNFINSGFDRSFEYKTLEIIERDLSEALKTGLSRPKSDISNSKYYLRDFARVMRGIATGANDFFFLTREQVESLNIPKKYVKLAVGRTKDVTSDIANEHTIIELNKKNRPTLLLSINENKDSLPQSVIKYIDKGEQAGLSIRPLIKQRSPWFKMEQREVPPILFTYLGRRNSRFIKNNAGVIPLTGFLCVYPYTKNEEYVKELWLVLNNPETISNLRFVGKSYGAGAIKVEPRGLESLPLPEHLVEEHLIKYQKQKKLDTMHSHENSIIAAASISN